MRADVVQVERDLRCPCSGDQFQDIGFYQIRRPKLYGTLQKVYRGVVLITVEYNGR